MSTEYRNFDQEAARWDEHPRRVQLAADIADAVARQVPLDTGMDALDFGCGTGLLTFRLAPRVGSMTGVDNSRGMLDVFRAKIAAQDATNVTARRVDLAKGDTLPGGKNLIVSNMTLHHIPDTAGILGQFRRALLDGGWLAIADLDSEEGRFHDDNQGVFHHGFDRRELRRIMTETGFCEIQDSTAAEIIKPTADGQLRLFTIFLIAGRARTIR